MRDLSRESIFVAGEWISATEEPITVENPANEEIIARVPQAGREEADRALRAGVRSEIQRWATQ